MTNEEALEILTDKWVFTSACEYSDFEQGEALDIAIKALASQRWIPCSEEPQEGYYLITVRYGKNYYVDVANYECGEWSSYSDEYKQNPREHKIVAYMPLPQPYKEGEE